LGSDSLTAPTDEELMAEVREGEIRRAATLFDRHSAAFYRYAMRMTGNREASEDLVQEIFATGRRFAMATCSRLGLTGSPGMPTSIRRGSGVLKCRLRGLSKCR
jgi:hypothetical protein